MASVDSSTDAPTAPWSLWSNQLIGRERTAAKYFSRQRRACAVRLTPGQRQLRWPRCARALQLHACIARRERTNTPSQALLLLNENEYLKAARSLAQEVLRQEGMDAAQRVSFAYEVVTSRLPDETDRSILLELLKDLERNYGENPSLAEALCEGIALDLAEARAELSAWTLLVNTLYNLDITKNRE